MSEAAAASRARARIMASLRGRSDASQTTRPADHSLILIQADGRAEGCQSALEAAVDLAPSGMSLPANRRTHHNSDGRDGCGLRSSGWVGATPHPALRA